MEGYCYCCGKKANSDEFEIVDKEFENLPDNEYVFLIDFLGLHHCTGEPEEFDDQGTPNVCRSCFDGARCEFFAINSKFVSIC